MSAAAPGGHDGPGEAGAAGPGPAPPRPALRRSAGDRMLFGVAGGLGRHLGVDPVLVRIAFVLLALFGGSGVVLYLVGLVVIPEEEPGVPVQPGGPSLRAPGNALVVAGAVLVLLGGWALLRQLVPGIGTVAGPVVLLAAGALLLVAGRR